MDYGKMHLHLVRSSPMEKNWLHLYNHSFNFDPSKRGNTTFEIRVAKELESM